MLRRFGRAFGRAATVIAVALVATSPSRAAAPPAVTTPAALYDTSTGELLYAEGLDQPWFPASLAKLMTAYLVFDAVKSGKLDWEAKLVYSDYARGQPATRLNLRAGIQPTINQATHALMLRSANDVAVALAEQIAGSEEAFVAAMNDKAKALGMTRTTFANPHGLPSELPQSTTARDMVLLGAAVARDFPDRMGLFSAPDVRIHKGAFSNQNDLLRGYPGADGMKTGYTCGAGYNVVASATRGGRRLIAVVFGMQSRTLRSQRAVDLLETGFRARGLPAGQSAKTLAPVGGRDEEGDDEPGPLAVRATLLTLPVTQKLADVPIASVESLIPADISRTLRIPKCPRPDRRVAKAK